MLTTTAVVTFYTLTVAVEGSGTGIVTPTVGTHAYIAGTTVWLTATADPGSTFDGWSGDAGGLTSPVSVTMDSDKQVTATFVSTACVSLAGITIVGETGGGPGVYTFGTVYEPTSATWPISYLWDNGDTVSTSIRSLSVGTYTLAVTATNCSTGMALDTHVVVIEHTIYLPVVFRDS